MDKNTCNICSVIINVHILHTLTIDCRHF